MRFFLVVCALTLGCSEEAPPCLAISRPAIELRVLGVASCNAVRVTVWTSEGWYAELDGPSYGAGTTGCPFRIGFERTGTFSVAVEAMGYRAVTEHGIVVVRIGGTCPGVETVERTVTLEGETVDASVPDTETCCPIAEWPSCDCFPTGGSGACRSICDGPPPAWSKEFDDNGCPYWKLHPTTLSCFPPTPDAGTSG